MSTHGDIDSDAILTPLQQDCACAGMVLDVTRWLPEHPGGNTIIPAQVGCWASPKAFDVMAGYALICRQPWTSVLSSADLGFNGWRSGHLS